MPGKRRIIALILFMTVCLLTTGLCAQEDPAQQIKDATSQIKSGKLKKPELVDAYLTRAWAFSDQEEYNPAIEDFSKVLELDPKNAEALSGRGWAYAEMEDFERANADFTKAIALNPKDADAYEGRAWCLEKEGKYEPALADYNQAIELNPNSADSYESRGWIWLDQGKYDQAVADFSKAIELKPGQFFAWQGRGQTYQETSRFEQSLADYTQALKLDPESYDVYLARSHVLESLGRLAEAAADAAKASELDPDATEARLRAEDLKARSAQSPSTPAQAAFSSTQIPLPPSERRVALVMGNSAYLHFPPLANPVNDADDMAASLEATGFTVRKCQNGNRGDMLEAVRQFGDDLKKGGVGLFFYAGHGVQVQGENYLVPVDADIRHQDEVEDRALKASSILRKMETAGNRLNIIILDACRNNPLPGSDRGGDRGLARMDAPRGSLLVYATAPGNVASDGQGRNGLFTSMFLKHMKTPGLPVETMLKRVRLDVMQESGDRQTPWNSSSLTGEFFFSP